MLKRLLSLFSKPRGRYSYLVEIRPMLEKYKIREWVREIRTVNYVGRWHKVPHITLVYNFRPKKGVKDWELAEKIQNVVSKYGIVKFYYDGLEIKRGRKGYVLAFKIEPSSELKMLRKELYESLAPLIEEHPGVKSFNEVDKDKFWFHATALFHIREEKYGLFEKMINQERKYLAHALRITLLKSGRIRYEYDTATKKLLTRKEALSREAYAKMVKEYRNQFGIERNEPRQIGKIWFISDTHFDHANIIKYTARPFVDVEEMNTVLVKNWNSMVKENDIVYFLGDMSFGRGSRDPCYWVDRLKGKIIYIRGNHEKAHVGKNSELLEYRGYRFLLVHDPENVGSFDGWIVHGHVHNNKLEKYPFINGERRTINVSVEVTNYKPVSLDWIISLEPQKVKRIETVLDAQLGSS